MSRVIIAALGLALLSCWGSPRVVSADPWAEKRERMVDFQIKARGVKNPRVLEAMRTVPRHRFVPEVVREDAYRDGPLPIGADQTISQPYMVAIMTELLDPQPKDVVLEIGTGSGYQAAVLGELVERVYSIEIVAPLAARARRLLAELGYENVEVITGDGYRGLPERAPFDAVMVTAAPDHIPEPLIEQLRPGGRLVIPVGRRRQHLKVLTKTEDGVSGQTLFEVRFVPMTGEAQERD